MAGGNIAGERIIQRDALKVRRCRHRYGSGRQRMPQIPELLACPFRKRVIVALGAFDLDSQENPRCHSRQILRLGIFDREEGQGNGIFGAKQFRRRVLRVATEGSFEQFAHKRDRGVARPRPLAIARESIRAQIRYHPLPRLTPMAPCTSPRMGRLPEFSPGLFPELSV